MSSLLDTGKLILAGELADLELLVGQRQPVILLNREAGCYRAVAGVLRDMLPADRFVTL